MTRPLVLLSNDDGYRARGILAMAAALRERFDVVVCAPDNEQSASSHSLSLNRPLRLTDHGDKVFSVDGTPADSVYVALNEEEILPRRPDLVLSGMNHGLNLGQDVFYSGTVAAAREGALHGFPALALSAHLDSDLARATQDAAEFAWKLLEAHRGGGILINVNYPAQGSWAKRPCVSGRRHYSGGLDRRADPRGRPYYWIGGEGVRHEGEEGTDTEAFDRGEVGVTPLSLDLSAGRDLAEVVQLCAALGGGGR